MDKTGLPLPPHVVAHTRAEHLPVPKQIPGVPRGALPLYPQQQPELFYPEARAPPGAQYDGQYSAGESTPGVKMLPSPQILTLTRHSLVFS